MSTVNACNAVHTSLGEVFVVSMSPSFEHKGMHDLLVEGDGKNAVFITGSKDDLIRICSAMNRAIQQIS
jgi:hypothetical protein